MQMSDKFFDSMMNAFVDERQYPETGQEDEGSLGPL
jgi:hypothetical protein